MPPGRPHMALPPLLCCLDLALAHDLASSCGPAIARFGGEGPRTPTLKRISIAFTEGSNRSSSPLLPSPLALLSAHRTSGFSLAALELVVFAWLAQLHSNQRRVVPSSYRRPPRPGSNHPSPACLASRRPDARSQSAASAPREMLLERPILHRYRTNLSALLVALDERDDATRTREEWPRRAETSRPVSPFKRRCPPGRRVVTNSRAHGWAVRYR